MSNAGLIFVRIVAAKTATMIAMAGSPVTDVLASESRPATARPIATGARPSWIDVRHGQFAKRFQTRPTKSVKNAVGTKNASRGGKRAGKFRDQFADRGDHHHIRSRGHLADAVHVHELVVGEPLVHVDDLVFHFGKRSHAAADRQQREVSEHTGYRRNLIHADSPSSLAWCGRFARIASAPTPSSVTGTDTLK